MVLAASSPHAPEAHALGEAARRGSHARPVRVGIINVMPRAETYESTLLRPLARSLVVVEPVWIRLHSHGYASSDSDRILRHYVDFAEATGKLPLDGLLVTGAPVEELDFEQVHYWDELSSIIRASRHEVTSTLGLCWGGLALAKHLGIGKRIFARKLFGVFQHANLAPEHPLLEGADDVFWCAHSRHSGVDAEDLQVATDGGVVRVLAHGREAGTTILESTDGHYVMHLGHPEYEPDRLVLEWRRDLEQGRSNVDPPAHFDLERPVNTWRSHRNDFFSQWLRTLAFGPRAAERATWDCTGPAT